MSAASGGATSSNPASGGNNGIHLASEVQAQQGQHSSGMLAASEDRYDGIIIDSGALPSDAATFTAQLTHSLAGWAAAGKRGVWLKVPLSHIQLVAPACQAGGFTPHHAEPEYVMLTRWLPDTPSSLPPSASHQVGVGAIVVNSRQELLVVQERGGPLRGTGVWKMPTGLVHAGEDITAAAPREVLEETGVRAVFDCVLAIRQAHGFAFGKSDMFVTVGLKLEPGQEDQPLVPQESEVVGVKWMPLQEYMDQQFMQGVGLYDRLRERTAAYARGQYRGWRAAKLEAGFLKPRSDLLLWGDDHGNTSPSAFSLLL